jgi:hypothetical protein
VLGRDRIGDVGERGGTLVGRDDQIRIVGVVAHAVLRMHDVAVDEIVGDVEQAVDEQPVAGHAFGEHRVAIASRWRALDEETTLRPDRHDDRVLDHLRLDQAEHLGAEVLAAV